MDEAVTAQLAALGDEVRAAALSEDCRQTALWCLGRLPPLYAQFRQTNESRYGDEITRLVQAMLKELAQSTKVCPQAQALGASLTERLRLLHEQLGLPRLAVKAPARSTPAPRKAGHRK